MSSGAGTNAGSSKKGDSRAWPADEEEQVRLPAVKSALATPQLSPQVSPQRSPRSVRSSVGYGDDPASVSASSSQNQPTTLPPAPPSSSRKPRWQAPAAPPRFADARGAGGSNRLPQSDSIRTTEGPSYPVHPAGGRTHQNDSGANSAIGATSIRVWKTSREIQAEKTLLRVLHEMRHPPLTLLLFLQSAPPKTIFSAFQRECAEWGVSWHSRVAQRIAVFLFLQHPVSRCYPPRSTTLRALLKQYINLIEQREMTALHSKDGDPDGGETVNVELMHAYIQCTVTMDGGVNDMCYKSFFNVNADDIAGSSAACTALMIRRLVEGAPVRSEGVSSPVYSLDDGSPRHNKADDGSFEWDTPNPLLSSRGSSVHSGITGDESPPPPPPPAMLSHGLVATPPPHNAARQAQVPPPPFTSSSAASNGEVGNHHHHPPTTTAMPPGKFAGASGTDSNASSSSSQNAAPPGVKEPFFEGTNRLLAAPMSHHLSPQEEEDAANEAIVRSTFCSLRVAVGQFANVGLSLWPAAFVLVQLMAQEMRGLSGIFWPRMLPGLPWPPKGPLPVRQRLRILELGAGVGLTPVLLNKMKVYRDSVDRFIATDYLPDMLANIQENLKINRVTEVKDFSAAERGLEGDKERPFHLVSTVDWMQKTRNAGKILDWGPNLVLAADCIYDVDAIPGLVTTIEQCLTGPSTENIFEFSHAIRNNSVDAITRTRTVVVVQTHRQNSTMKVFFDRLKPFAQVQSYTLVTGKTASELRRTYKISETRDGLDGGLVPLGEWPKAESSLDNSSIGSDGDGGALLDLHATAATASAADRVVCALQPDTVLEDGSMASITLDPPTPSPTGGVGAWGTTSNGRVKPQQTLSPRLPPVNSTSPQRSPQPSLAPISPANSFQTNSNHSSSSLDGDSPAARVEALLRDELIGPFYTPMAGLIGVHVIQLKKDATLAPPCAVVERESRGGRPSKMGFGFSKKREKS